MRCGDDDDERSFRMGVVLNVVVVVTRRRRAQRLTQSNPETPVCNILLVLRWRWWWLWKLLCSVSVCFLSWCANCFSFSTYLLEIETWCSPHPNEQPKKHLQIAIRWRYIPYKKTRGRRRTRNPRGRRARHTQIQALYISLSLYLSTNLSTLPTQQLYLLTDHSHSECVAVLRHPPESTFNLNTYNLTLRFFNQLPRLSTCPKELSEFIIVFIRYFTSDQNYPFYQTVDTNPNCVHTAWAYFRFSTLCFSFTTIALELF